MSLAVEESMPTRLTFTLLGSGSSVGTPRISCMMSPTGGCDVCRRAAASADSKDRRSNPSALLQLHWGGDVRPVHLLIDATKTIKESVQHVLMPAGITYVDALFLTHAHADAMFGLDELRDLPCYLPADLDEEERRVALRDKVTPVYLTDYTLAGVKRVMHYLFPPPEVEDVEAEATAGKKDDAAAAPPPTAGVDDKGKPLRWTSKIDWRILNPGRATSVYGLPLTCFDVWHGHDTRSLGYSFGARGELLYISDVSAIDEDQLAWLETLDTELLVIDSLLPAWLGRTHGTHMSEEASLEVVRRLRPRRTLFIGLGHAWSHDADNERLAALLAEEGLDVQLGYDGQQLSIDLSAAEAKL
eukprot:PLAT8860.1.p1 GENE.PLAT8860.1~~PLAT8860.1.p1  ORF type:complete len:358 (+),score=168.92 PLAT8860.1:1-1074(+)